MKQVSKHALPLPSPFNVKYKLDSRLYELQSTELMAKSHERHYYVNSHNSHCVFVCNLLSGSGLIWGVSLCVLTGLLTVRLQRRLASGACMFSEQTHSAWSRYTTHPASPQFLCSHGLTHAPAPAAAPPAPPPFPPRLPTWLLLAPTQATAAVAHNCNIGKLQQYVTTYVPRPLCLTFIMCNTSGQDIRPGSGYTAQVCRRVPI